MKKLTLLALALLGMSSMQAQNKFSFSSGNAPAANVKHYPQGLLKSSNAANKNGGPSVLTTLFTEDFANGLPATWAQVDSAGNGEIWTHTTTGPVNAPTIAVLASTTAANGWMMHDDDGYGNNGTIASASLITPSFDCSGKQIVALSLYEEFVAYTGSEGVIYVSNDSINWTAVHNVNDYATTGATANPFVPVIDISSIAANQSTVYLKFTYRGDWGFWWQIDDIIAYEPTGIDITANSVNPLTTEYTMVPLLQTNNMALSGTVRNLGGAATTGGTAMLEALDSATNAVVFSQTVSLPTIAPLGTVVISTTNNLLLPSTGSYKIRMTTNIAGDTNPLNDTTESLPTQITDSVYARDNGTVFGSFYNDPGTTNNITGQNFALNTTAQVTSISFFASNQTINSTFPLFITIHNQSQGSGPTTLPIATTDTIQITSGSVAAGGQWITIPISTFSVTLTPGLYYFGLNQEDPDFLFGASGAIATPGTTWLSWNTIPSPPAVNGWATAEDLVGVNVSFMIRPNFGDVTAGINTVNSLSDFDVYPNPSNGIISVTNGNNNGADYSVSVFNTIGQSVYYSKSNTAAITTIDLSTQPAGVYHVKVSNNSGSFNKSIVISNK